MMAEELNRPRPRAGRREWWQSWKLWLAVAVVAALAATIAVTIVGRRNAPPNLPYSAFLDQLEAGNVTSVTFQGLSFDATLKRAVTVPLVRGEGVRDHVASRMPDFGDPSLLPELRREHVVIVVNASSAGSLWSSLLVRIPWTPVLIGLVVVVGAGFMRLRRGGQTQPGAGLGATAPGWLGLLSGAFGKPRSANPQPREGGDLERVDREEQLGHGDEQPRQDRQR